MSAAERREREKGIAMQVVHMCAHVGGINSLSVCNFICKAYGPFKDFRVTVTF